MIVASMLLVVAGFVALLLGVFGVGDEPLLFVYGSIGACLLAAVFLVAGVLRARPSRSPVIVDDPRQPTWSGAAMPEPGPAPGRGRGRARREGATAGDTHVEVLSAREAAAESGAAAVPATRGDGEEAEQERFARALEGLDLDTARVERLRGRFVTPERLAAASVDDLADVPGISRPLADAIAARVRSATRGP